jgi:superfamily II DNA or RNA helicase
VTSLTAQLAAVVAMYHDQAIEAAKAEAEHKRVRAKRFLRALHDDEAKSAAMADNVAEADDLVAELYSKRLIAAAIADSTKQKLMSLREEIGMERTRLATEREMDRLHSTDRNVP